MNRTIISRWRTIPKSQIIFCCLLNITSLQYLEGYPKQKFVMHICPILDFSFGTAWIFPDLVWSADFSFVGWFLSSPCREGEKSIIQYRSWQAGCQDQKLCILNPFQSSSISTIHNLGIKISIEMRPTDTSVNIA